VQLMKAEEKELSTTNGQKRIKSLGEGEVGRYWSPEEERKISTLWESKGEQKKVSKVRTTCKSHTDDKVAKGECCQQKESCG